MNSIINCFQNLNNSPTMNTEDEKLCLKWNEFQENTISAFGTLRHDKEFADVTLACEDGQQVEAHKVILASSSPFFLNLIKRNKHPHPLIYMRGLKSEDLVAMIEFLYFGEANVYQENLDSFLAVAEELQLKGLMGSGADEVKEVNNKPTVQEKAKNHVLRKKNPKQDTTASDNTCVAKVESSPPLEGTVAVTDYTVAADLQDLDDKIKSMIGYSDNKIGRGAHPNQKAKVCKVCGKEGEMGLIRDHIEAHHITGVSHTCNICGRISRSRAALRVHKITYHKTRK